MNKSFRLSQPIPLKYSGGFLWRNVKRVVVIIPVILLIAFATPAYAGQKDVSGNHNEGSVSKFSAAFDTYVTYPVLTNTQTTINLLIQSNQYLSYPIELGIYSFSDSLNFLYKSSRHGFYRGLTNFYKLGAKKIAPIAYKVTRPIQSTILASHNTLKAVTYAFAQRTVVDPEASFSTYKLKTEKKPFKSVAEVRRYLYNPANNQTINKSPLYTADFYEKVKRLAQKSKLKIGNYLSRYYKSYQKNSQNSVAYMQKVSIFTNKNTSKAKVLGDNTYNRPSFLNSFFKYLINIGAQSMQNHNTKSINTKSGVYDDGPSLEDARQNRKKIIFVVTEIKNTFMAPIKP